MLDSCYTGLTFSSEVAEVDSAVKLSAASLLLITSSPLQRRAEHNNYVKLVSPIARKMNQSINKKIPGRTRAVNINCFSWKEETLRRSALKSLCAEIQTTKGTILGSNFFSKF